MSSPREKKVHYERGTKGEKEKSHRHHSSRDSGFGSSSASDRASLGTSPLDESPFNHRQIQDQRNSVAALQEALDAANEKVRQLEAANARLNSSLAESNREVRLLKKERLNIERKNDELMDDLEDMRVVHEKYRREGSPRTGHAAPSKTERRATPPKADSRRDRRSDEGSKGGFRDRRTSYVPVAPQTPLSPNPFNPLPTRGPSVSYGVPSVSYATPVTYAPAALAYTTSPIYSSPPPSTTSSRGPLNDGKYHAYPV